MAAAEQHQEMLRYLLQQLPVEVVVADLEKIPQQAVQHKDPAEAEPDTGLQAVLAPAAAVTAVAGVEQAVLEQMADLPPETVAPV